MKNGKGVKKYMKFSEKLEALKEEIKKYKGQQILKNHLIMKIEEMLDINSQTAEKYLKELEIRGIIKETGRHIYEYIEDENN